MLRLSRLTLARTLFACLLFGAALLRAEVVSKPDGRILFQPQLLWADSDTTLQGTGYLIEHHGKYFGVTSIHFLNFDAGGLRAAAWVDVFSERPVTPFRSSLGRPARTAINRMRATADDFLLLPCAELPEDSVALRLEHVAKYEPGARLWFPNKSRDVEIGHTWVDATVIEDAGYWIQVRLAEKLPLQSQSGSPVLNDNEGFGHANGNQVSRSEIAPPSVTSATREWELETGMPPHFLANVLANDGCVGTRSGLSRARRLVRRPAARSTPVPPCGVLRLAGRDRV